MPVSQYQNGLTYGPNGQENGANHQTMTVQGGGIFGTGLTNGTYSPNAQNFQYSSAYGNDQQTEQKYNQLAGQAQGRQGALIQNQYADQDRANVNGLANYYQGQLNGTAPSLAQAQMNAATTQSVQAQQAAANSSRGSLNGALAARTAAQNGAQMQQNAAQQAMIGRIQEEQNAAQNLGGLYQGQQSLDAQTALQQAQIDQSQHGLNDQMTMGYAGMGQQTAMGQLNANQAYENAMLNEQQLTQQNAEFQSQQADNAFGGILGMLGGAAAADLKFREPGGGSGFTLREEPGFLLLRNDRTGELGKVATQPLTPAEHRQAMAPHGAGPLGATLPVKDPRTGNLFASDLHVEDARPQLSHCMGYR